MRVASADSSIVCAFRSSLAYAAKNCFLISIAASGFFSLSFTNIEFDSSENQAFLTNPSDFFYSYYIDMFNLEPNVVSGSWGEFSEEDLNEVLSSNPDSIHRIRLSSLDDSALSIALSQDYSLANKSETTGMVVEHWTRK